MKQIIRTLEPPLSTMTVQGNNNWQDYNPANRCTRRQGQIVVFVDAPTSLVCKHQFAMVAQCSSCSYAPCANMSVMRKSNGQTYDEIICGVHHLPEPISERESRVVIDVCPSKLYQVGLSSLTKHEIPSTHFRSMSSNIFN